MAMLQLDTLPVTGQHLDLPTVIETAEITGILIDDTNHQIVLVEREEGEYIDIETDSPENAEAVFNELHYLVRLIHAEWIDISELPGFDFLPPTIIRKEDIRKIEFSVRNAGPSDGERFVSLLIVDEEPVKSLILISPDDIAVLRIIFCS